MFTIIKRDGTQVPYNAKKIKNAIRKAGFINEATITKVVNSVESLLKEGKTLSVEEIQDIVEESLMKSPYKFVAREYIRYRQTRNNIRNHEKTNESILKLIDNKNEYLKTENSNKNHMLASTQRDYIAGEVSKDITMRHLLPKEVVDAHNKGIIHFHK